MPTTTKMGIVYPSSSDLVKDGATAMGTISTTVDNKTGLVLIKSATFSAVSSVSLDAGTFSSIYDYYSIYISGVSSADVSLKLRLRTSGSDNSTSNYYWSGVFTNRGAGPSRTSGTAANYFEAGTTGDSGFATQINVFYPNNTTYKTFLQTSAFADFGTDTDTRNSSGLFNVTTQFDSLSILPDSGTFSGRYSVFGVNQ